MTVKLGCGIADYEPHHNRSGFGMRTNLPEGSSIRLAIRIKVAVSATTRGWAVAWLHAWASGEGEERSACGDNSDRTITGAATRLRLRDCGYQSGRPRTAAGDWGRPHLQMPGYLTVR